MKEILLKNGRTILVDDEDYENAIQYNWFVNSTYTPKGTYSRVATSLNGKTTYYKSIILGIRSPKISLQKNGNPLDLRKENIIVFDSAREFLRALRQMKKSRNDDGYTTNKAISKSAQGRTPHGRKRNSKYIGVIKTQYARPWMGIIIHDYNKYHLGSFENEEDAALAYDKKAIELYGSDARVNFPHLTFEELTERLEQLHSRNAELYNENVSKGHQGRCSKNVIKTSKYIGVCTNTNNRLKPWRAQISHKNKQHWIGNFKTEVEAAAAYDEKAIELYGENAKVNFKGDT